MPKHVSLYIRRKPSEKYGSIQECSKATKRKEAKKIKKKGEEWEHMFLEMSFNQTTTAT
jgi:hypothetical protein